MLNSLFFKLINLLIYFWLCWVLVSVRGLSLVVASGAHSSSRCAGLSLSWSLLLQSTGSRCAGPVVVAHGPSCSAACGILPDQGSNPCPLQWQADSQPLCHQGSPKMLNSLTWDIWFSLIDSNLLKYRLPGLCCKKLLYILSPPLPLWSSLSELFERLCPGLKSSVLSTKENIILNF